MTDDTPLRQLLDDRLTAGLAASELVPEAADLLRGMLPEPAGPERTGRAGPVYLRSITAAGWRGVGPETTLDLPPGPGLTVVAGRNGTGKSSFAEAAEMALTGFNARWDGSNGKARTAVWKEGWRNLHDSTVPTVSVRLTLDDTGDPVTVRRTWYGAKVDEARTTVEWADGTEQKLEESIDASTLSLYRPFLPYSELGSMVDGTLSALHNTLARFVGLGQLGDIDDLLAARVKACKDVENRPRALKTAAPKPLPDSTTSVPSKLLGHSADVPPMRPLSAPCSTATWSPPPVRTSDSGHSPPCPALTSRRSPARWRGCGRRLPQPRTYGTLTPRTRGGSPGCWRVPSNTVAAPRTPTAPSAAPRTVWTRPGRTARGRRSSGSSRGRPVRSRPAGARRRGALHDLVQPVPDLLRAEESELAGLGANGPCAGSLTDPAELANRVERVAPRLGAACRQVGEEAARKPPTATPPGGPRPCASPSGSTRWRRAAEAKDRSNEA